MFSTKNQGLNHENIKINSFAISFTSMV